MGADRTRPRRDKDDAQDGLQGPHAPGRLYQHQARAHLWRVWGHRHNLPKMIGVLIPVARLATANAGRVRGCSGTKMRKYARGEMPEEDPPEGFMVPSAWKIVKECARPTSHSADQLTNQPAI
jgi:hypothetical protein